MRFNLRNFLSDDLHHAAVIKNSGVERMDLYDYHPHFEIYYCRNYVRQDIILNGQSLVMDTPCVVITRPFSIHSMSPGEDKDSPFERYTFFFGDHFLSGISEEMLPQGIFAHNCVFPLSEQQNAQILPIFDLLIASAKHSAEARSCFCLLLNTLSRIVPEHSRIIRDASDHYVIEALKYIYGNRAQDLSAEHISAYFHVSRAKLDRDFRKFVGQSVHNTVISARLEAAVERLSSTDLTVREIALECGFESEYYFYSFFKKNTGKTPSAFRSSASTLT